VLTPSKKEELLVGYGRELSVVEHKLLWYLMFLDQKRCGEVKA
jgi:hypothetical protein